MEFRAASGETLTGEVWSPGPVAESVWVLLFDGSSRAVKFPSKKRPYLHEVLVSRPDPTDPYGERVIWEPYCPPRTDLLSAPTPASQQLRQEARNAPPLAPKLWRSVLNPALLP